MVLSHNKALSKSPDYSLDLTLTSTIQKIQNWGTKGHGLGHVTYMLILGPLYISGTAKATNMKFGVQIDRTVLTCLGALGPPG